jgi:hypothetical protein
VAQDPELIRRDIEATRRDMGETADALAYKANVPGRAKDRVTGTMDSLRGRTPGASDVKSGAKQAVSTAESNPLGLAIGFAAAGFIGGLLAPRTRVEDERIGPLADQVKEQARETGQEALERGKQVAAESVEAAKETAQGSAQQQGSELRASAQQSAQTVTNR